MPGRGMGARGCGTGLAVAGSKRGGARCRTEARTPVRETIRFMGSSGDSANPSARWNAFASSEMA